MRETTLFQYARNTSQPDPETKYLTTFKQPSFQQSLDAFSR